MDDAVWDQVESHYQRDNCSTKNEFIEKAIRFYSGYLDTESADAYLPRVLADVLEGKLGALGKRHLCTSTHKAHYEQKAIMRGPSLKSRGTAALPRAAQ